MWLEGADHQQVKLGTFRTKRLPRLDQLDKPLVTDHAADETYYLGVEWNAKRSRVAARTVPSMRAGLNTVSAATPLMLPWWRTLILSGWHNPSATAASRSEALTQKTWCASRHDTFSAHCSSRRFSPVAVMSGKPCWVDPHRHARQPRPHHTEQPALRRVGVDDVRPHLTQPAPQPGRRGQVARRRDAPRHLQAVNRDAFARGKQVEQLARRGERPHVHSPGLHVADLPLEDLSHSGTVVT